MVTMYAVTIPGTESFSHFLIVRFSAVSTKGNVTILSVT